MATNENCKCCAFSLSAALKTPRNTQLMLKVTRNMSVACILGEYLKREWARHTELCLCVSQCFSAYACHTVDGTVYVWFRPCVQSLQLSLPDAPQRRPVPRLHLAGLPAALPSLCAKLNLGWRIQLVSNLLTLSREWFGGTLTNFSRCFLKKCSAKSFLIYRGWLSQPIVTVLPVIIFFLKLHF